MIADLDFPPEERDALRGAFLRLIPLSDRMAETLYARFFDRTPEVRTLFSPTMEDQRDKLVMMLASMVDCLERPQEFAESCRLLGERHREYGAKVEHYGPLGEAMIGGNARGMRPPAHTPRRGAFFGDARQNHR